MHTELYEKIILHLQFIILILTYDMITFMDSGENPKFPMWPLNDSTQQYARSVLKLVQMHTEEMKN